MAFLNLVEEDQHYLRIRQWRDKVFRPLCLWLKKFPISPDHLTYAGFLMMIPFVYFFHFHPWLSFLFLMLNLLLDSLDGVFARLTGKTSPKGDFLDHGLDYLSFFIAFLTVQFYGMVDNFWATLYLLNYLIMIFLEVMAKQSNIKIFPTIKTKFGFYGLIFIWLVSGQSFLNPCMVLATVYMMVTNVFLFHRIRWAL